MYNKKVHWIFQIVSGVMFFPHPFKHDHLNTSRVGRSANVSQLEKLELLWILGYKIRKNMIMKRYGREESSVCVCARGRRVQCHRQIGFSWQRDKRMVSRFGSAEDFFLEGVFLSSISLFQNIFHLYECNALSVKNVERLITVWWSKAWDDVFALYLVTSDQS